MIALTPLDGLWVLLQAVIIGGLLVAAWAGWRLLQYEPHETRCIVGVDLAADGSGAMVVAHVEDGTLYVDQVHHVRVFRPPFDWSQHPGL